MTGECRTTDHGAVGFGAERQQQHAVVLGRVSLPFKERVTGKKGGSGATCEHPHGYSELGKGKCFRSPFTASLVAVCRLC